MNSIDPEKREEWLDMLNAPIPGAPKKKPTKMQVEDEGEGFMQALAAFGG